MKLTILDYVFPRETVTAIMIHGKNTKAIVCLSDGDTEFFDIITGVLRGDILAICLFINCRDNLKL